MTIATTTGPSGSRYELRDNDRGTADLHLVAAGESVVMLTDVDPEDFEVAADAADEEVRVVLATAL